MHSIRQGAASELWQVLVREGSERSGQALDEMQESYLVFMLLRHQGDAHLLARTQALDFLTAQQAAFTLRADALRDVGDRCLLIAGLYPEYARRRVGVEYFIDLGRGAYRDVADASRAGYAELFALLSRTYHGLVRTLQAVRALPDAASRLPS